MGCQPIAIASGTAERISAIARWTPTSGVDETTIRFYFVIYQLNDISQLDGYAVP